MQKDKQVNKSATRTIMNSISSSLGNIFQNTFFSPAKIYDDTKFIKDDINNTINDIISHNEDLYGDVNMANLYERMNPTDGSIKLNDDVFGAKQVTDSMTSNFIQNRQLLEYESTIDTIIKYMPILQDTLNVKKDHVLCADHYTRDYINAIDEISGASSSDQNSIFNKNIKYIKDKYNLIANCDKWYDATAKYGEKFIYIIGYDEAIGRLRRNNKDRTIKNESVITVNEYTSLYDDYTNSKVINEEGSISVSLNYGVIESAISSTKKINTLNEAAQSIVNAKPIVPDKLGFEGLSQESLIDTGNFKNHNNNDKNYESPKLDIRGCIVKQLKRENIIPLYIDETCLGYYYLECNFKDIVKSKSGGSFFKGNMAYMMNGVFNNTMEKTQDNALNFVSSKISDMIDDKFINDNTDLKKEIYLILKHNEFANKSGGSVNITFIPPSDIVHMKFEDDEETHRGISDLDKSIVPASMYTSLLTTNTIGILTRGFDKRVYYVKQRVDTNISGVLLNTMNQLKRGNMGVREVSNPKTILKLSGRYNDHVIPVGPSGDSPVSIENLPGQDIDTKPELMETLKEQTIGPTDVPLDYVDQTKQVDFATRLTMSSYKFLRAIYKRQGLVNIFLSHILQKIYDYEFPPIDGNNNIKVKIKVQLPTPAYLDQMAIGEVFRVTNEYSSGLAEAEYADDNDPNVNIKKKLFIGMHNKAIMGSQIDKELIDNIKTQVDMLAKTYPSQDM